MHGVPVSTPPITQLPSQKYSLPDTSVAPWVSVIVFFHHSASKYSFHPHFLYNFGWSCFPSKPHVSMFMLSFNRSTFASHGSYTIFQGINVSFQIIGLTCPNDSTIRATYIFIDFHNVHLVLLTYCSYS